jgi:hypothetical protein
MSETSVHRRLNFPTTQVLAGFALGPKALALAATACLVVSGCSPGVDYPSIFPAVHDMPPPRADAPMDADQVQQATEDLITQRNHLSAEMQSNGQAKNAANPPANAVNQPAAKGQSTAPGGTKSAASANTQGGTAAAGTVTAGTETK